MPAPAVIFDLGGVLIDWNPRHLYRKLLPGDEAAMERFLAEICSPAWNAELDGGRPFSDGVRELSERHPEYARLIEAYHTRWPEMLGGVVEGSVELLEELSRTGVALYALTNWSAETYPIAGGRFPFLRRFRGIVVSGQERLQKPDPRFFQVLLRRYSVAPETALFIDDSAANVDEARRLGMSGVVFRSAAALRRELVALKLLP